MTAAALVLAAALLATAPPTALADGPGDWPMYHHDLAHTGIVRTGSGPLDPCGGAARSRR